ncbi:MAG: SusC/RagA family TonB-linked outer membrane protein [Bacteroidales bacterium]|nr:SusC/RagA family TonB-linked outer membrane protein [Bacteroidales bacterium]
MKNKHLLFLVLLLLIVSHVSLAQEQLVTGKVISSDDGLGLPGVAVQVKGETTGTVTDIDGQYQIMVDAKGTLVFSFVGFTTQEIAVNGRNKINVTLEQDAQLLDDVVVTALGIKRQKRELGYATEEIGGEMIAKSGSGSVISALSGRSAGVQIINPTGVDGGSSRITIRGNNSILGDNQPLIVVDGVPMTNEGGVTEWSGGRDWGTALNNINQEDIENIDILKGPTAAALYGSRGGNGVVLITTKKGSKQRGLGISYTASYKITQPYLYRKVQNKYGAGGPITFNTPTLTPIEGLTDEEGNQVYEYPGIYSVDEGPAGEPTNTTFGYYGAAQSWGPAMNGESVLWWDGVIRKYDPQPDNLSMLYHYGHTMNNNISLQNAGDFGSVRVSFTDSRTDAIIDNCNLRQTTVNVGSLLNVSDKIKADVAFTYLDYYRLNSPEIGESNSNFNKGLLYSWPRSWKGLETTAYENPDGTMNPFDGYPFQYINSSTFWTFYNNNTTLDRDKMFGSVRLLYDITPWLSASAKVALDWTADTYITKNKPTTADHMVGGYYQKNKSTAITRDMDFLLTAYKDKIFNTKFNVRFSFGGEQYYGYRDGMSGTSGTWAYANLYTIYNYSSATERNFQESRWEKQVNSVYGFLNLSYSDWMFLDVTGRNDWSSTLPITNNSYFYPSATLSFVPTSAFKQWNWGPVNYLKLRSSWAMTASDTEPYQLTYTYNTGSFGHHLSSSLPSVVPPLELKPQRQRAFELGFDLGLGARFNMDFTYYDIYSWDQILSSPLAPSSGASNVTINTGVVTNKGIEAIMTYDIAQGKDYGVQVGLNFARNRNKIVDLSGANMYTLSEIWGSNGPAVAVEEGEEYGTIYGWDYVYQYTTPNGTTVGPFYDANGNPMPLLNETGTTYLITENRVPVGNCAPWVTGGVNMRASYKNWSLYALIDAKLGGQIYCASYVVAMQTGQSPESLYEREGNGLPYYDADGNFVGNYGVILPGYCINTQTGEAHENENVVHYLYRYMPNYGGWGKIITTPGIVNNNWIKMRELALTYDFPRRILDKQSLFKQASISLVGRDLFYLYKDLPDNINPEGTQGTGNAQGLEYASYPGSRSVMLTLKVNL